MPDKQAENRNPDGTFKPGICPNPGGRPKGSVSLKTKLRALLTESAGGGKDYADALVQKTLKDALSGDAQARKLVWEYIEGKPTQQLEHSGGLTIVDLVRDAEASD